MTRGDLQAATRKKLAQLARRHRIVGWHSMRKDELVNALVRLARRDGLRTDQSARSAGPRTERCRLKPARRCDRRGPVRDQLVVEEVDERWLHARWVLSERILERARVALGTEWPHAVPVLRVYGVTDRNGAADRAFVKDEEIRQPMDDWYFPIARCGPFLDECDGPHPSSGRSCRVELGYRTPQGAFFVLARSARVRTRQLAGMWGSKPHDGTTNGSSDNGKAANGSDRDARGVRVADHRAGAETEPGFEIDADIVLHGRVHPRANLTLMGKPLQPHADGTFAVRMPLGDGRQVIPAVCVAPNGCTQRTTVLAVERNTKRLDPMPLDDLR